MPGPDSDEILDLIGSIYDVAMSENGWEPLLERMTRLFEGRATVFFVRDLRAVETVFFRFWGLPEGLITESIERFTTMDVGLDSLLTLAPGTIVTDDADASQVEPRTEALRDFLERWDVERYLGADVFRDARRFGVVAVLGSRSRPPFGPREVEALKTLIPHLRQAVELRSHVEEQAALRSVAQNVIEGMLTGVVLLGADGRILTANAAARRIAEARDGLVIERDRLRAINADDDELLRKNIAEAIAISETHEGPGGAALNVRRGPGTRPYALVVSPGASAVAASPTRIASAVVLIGDPDSGLGSAEAVAVQVYGLTPSEARLACAVASGESLESYAKARGIAVATARWTMKQTLAKTGTRRQADLVRLLLTGPVSIALRGRKDA